MFLEILGDMTYTFDEDGTWELEYDWGLNSGTYSLSNSDYTITTLREESFGVSEAVKTIETGTWSRNGNTLTLTSTDNVVMVLKKI